MAVVTSPYDVYKSSIFIGININIKLYTYVEKITYIDCITQ